MDGTWIAVIVIVAVLVLALVGLWVYWMSERKRSRGLRDTFGPEYDRAIEERGRRRNAESELESRRRRVDALDIRPLSREDHDRFTEAWTSTQAQFVDDPDGAVRSADRLVADVLQARGYPVGDFDRRAADVSVHHGEVVDNYRRAHEIAQAEERGEASTEDLRQAMVCYRELFSDLLETGEVRKAG